MSQESGNKWEMPEPKFRHSTGELVKPSKPVEFDIEPDTLAPDPQSEPELAVDPEADTLIPNAPDEAEFAVGPEPDTLAPDVSPEESSEDPLAKLYAPPESATGEPAPEPTAAPPIPVEIEPQPYVSEQLSAEKIVVETQTRPTKGSARPMALAVGLFVLLCIAAGIAALVYYLLYMNRPDSGGF